MVHTWEARGKQRVREEYESSKKLATWGSQEAKTGQEGRAVRKVLWLGVSGVIELEDPGAKGFKRLSTEALLEQRFRRPRKPNA
jgi:hypothetical protein